MEEGANMSLGVIGPNDCLETWSADSSFEVTESGRREKIAKFLYLLIDYGR